MGNAEQFTGGYIKAVVKVGKPAELSRMERGEIIKITTKLKIN